MGDKNMIYLTDLFALPKLFANYFGTAVALNGNFVTFESPLPRRGGPTTVELAFLHLPW